MQVTVKLFATFRIGRFKQGQRDCADGASCREVATDIGLAREEIGLVLINGRHGNLEQTLQEGDVLALFPLLGGG